MTAPADRPASAVDEDFDSEADFDLDAEVAVQLEAEHRPIKVKIGGRLIPFPQMSVWPWEAVEYLQAGSLIECLEILFPTDLEDIEAKSEPERRAIRERNKETLDYFRDVPTGALRRLFEHFQAKSGVTPGESRRSARRSRSTRRR